MNNNMIITIGRECGSAGRTIGQKVAEAFGIKCYDKELLAIAAKESGFSEELFHTHDEKPTNSFFYSLVMDNYAMGGYHASGYVDMPLNHKIFLAQFDTIKKLAERESCVIVGRCADYALSEFPNVISVFIRAEEKDKLQRMTEKYDVPADKARDVMIKTDKRRASYYNYYSNKKWGSSKSYDLCLNSSAVGVDGAVEIIKAFALAKMAYRGVEAEKPEE